MERELQDLLDKDTALINIIDNSFQAGAVTSQEKIGDNDKMIKETVVNDKIDPKHGNTFRDETVGDGLSGDEGKMKIADVYKMDQYNDQSQTKDSQDSVVFAGKIEKSHTNDTGEALVMENIATLLKVKDNEKDEEEAVLKDEQENVLKDKGKTVLMYTVKDALKDEEEVVLTEKGEAVPLQDKEEDVPEDKDEAALKNEEEAVLNDTAEPSLKDEAALENKNDRR